jgi:hypothetical protein
MEKYIGSDQSELGVPLLAMQGQSVRDAPPYLACSDPYNEFVRHGKIEVVKGRLEKVHEDGDKVSIEVSIKSSWDDHLRYGFQFSRSSDMN